MEILDPKLTFTHPLTPLDPDRIEKIILHHTASPTATVWDVHKQHLGRGWKGIGYNYMVHRDGKIYEGRGLNIGAHAGADWNPRSIGISCQGYLHDDGTKYTQEMTDAQVNSVAWLCAKFIKQFNLTVQDIIGHYVVMSTACPGNRFRWADVRAMTEEYLKGVSTMPDKLDRQAHSWEVAGLEWLVEMGYLDEGAHEPQEVMTKGLFGTLMKRMRFAVDGQVTLGQGQVDKAKR